MNYFGTSSQRIQDFREEILLTKPSICTERALLATKTYKEHADKQTVLKRAYVLDGILRSMSIYIEDKTLLAGNQANVNRAAPIFPEYAIDWVLAELDEFSLRDGDSFEITEKSKQAIREIEPYWRGATLKNKGLAAFPTDSKRFYDLGIIKTEGNITSGDAHLAVNYEKILKIGLAGYRKSVQEHLNALDLADFEQMKKSYLYHAMLIVLDATIAFSGRYVHLAKKIAEKEKNPLRKQELLEIARIMAKVPENPPDTFHEALQAIWLIQLVLQIESNGHSLSYGRMDQYLLPFYERDVRVGSITEESACELLENLWLKTYTVNKVRSWSHTRFSAGSPLYQNVTIGGQTVDGEDAVNDLSYLVLRSVARLKLPQPNLTVRYHRGVSDAFMRECIQVMRLGFGMPAFNSDEIIIPSLIEKGVTKEDAHNYSAIGCVEVAVPGKWGYRVTGMSFLNFPKTLLIAMNNGRDIGSGEVLCQGDGHFQDMQSFDELMAAWDKTVRAFARHAVILDSAADLVLEQEVPDILCSCLVDDCIGRGKHIKEGGAVYDFISDLQVGIANLGDSLAAIKKCVFEDKSVTPAGLWNALLSDFQGEEGERIRRLLLHSAPKYGNDDDYIDLLLVQAYASYIDEIKHYKNTRYGRGPIGGVYYAGTSSISANVPQGVETMATPDGRHAGVPFAEGCSPSHETDISGPTSVFKSVAKLDTRSITGGVLLNQKVTPQMLAREDDRLKLISMLRTFFDELKGFHVQYNVVSRDTLLDAQVHPEKHRDLVVRVAGYSAFFGVLSKVTQDDIIARTEQSF